MKYENKKSKRKNYYTGFKCLEILLKNGNVSSGLFQRFFNGGKWADIFKKNWCGSIIFFKIHINIKFNLLTNKIKHREKSEDMDTNESGVIYESEVDLYINYIDHTKIKEVEKNFSSFLLWCDELNKNTQSEEIENIEGKNKNNKTTSKDN